MDEVVRRSEHGWVLLISQDGAELEVFDPEGTRFQRDMFIEGPWINAEAE